MLSREWKEPRTRAWDYALSSRIHVLYYQGRIARLKGTDNLIRVVAAIAASGTVGSLLKDASVAGISGHRISVILALTSAVLLAVSAALQIPERIRGFGVLLAEYTAHKHRFDRLYLKAHQEPVAEFETKLDRAIDGFNQTEKREPKDDPAPDRGLLAKCQLDVEKALGPAQAAPSPAA